jgi:hypothetical protein
VREHGEDGHVVLWARRVARSDAGVAEVDLRGDDEVRGRRLVVVVFNEVAEEGGSSIGRGAVDGRIVVADLVLFQLGKGQ